MTYALAWPLQEAIFQLLCNNPICNEHFGGQIFDAPLPLNGEAELQGLYLVIGDEEAQDWSTSAEHGAVHVISLNVHAPRRGFSEAKRAAAEISDAILNANLILSRGRVVSVHFVDARASI